MCLASRTITGSHTALASDPTSKQWKDFAAKEFMENKTRLTPFTESSASPPLSPSQTTKLAVRSHDHDDDNPTATVVSSPNPGSPWLEFAAHNHETQPPPRHVNTYDASRSKSPPSCATLKRSISDKVGQQQQQQRGDLVGMQHYQEQLYLYAPQLSSDPPKCFCNQPAHIRNTSDHGIVYECYRVTTSSDSAMQSLPVCCTFHVHKEPWSSFQQAFHNGRRIDPNHPHLQQCSAFNYTFRTIFRTENAYPMRLPMSPLCYCNHLVRPHQDYTRTNNRMALVCPKMASDLLRYKACQWFMWAEDAKALQSALPHPTSSSLSDTISTTHHDDISASNTTTSSIDKKEKNDRKDVEDNDETSSTVSTSQQLKHSNDFSRDNGLMTAPSSPNTLDAKSTTTSEDASIYKATPVHMIQPPSKQLSPDTDKSLELIRLLKGAKVPEWYSDDQHHHHQHHPDTVYHGDTASLDSDDHSSTQSTVPGSPSSPFKVSMPVPASVYARILLDKKKSEYDDEQVSTLNQHALMMENELKRLEDENQQVKTVYAAKEDEWNSLLRAHEEDLAEMDRWEEKIKDLVKLDNAMELLWDNTCDIAEEEISNVRKAKQCEIMINKLKRDLVDRMEQLKLQIAKKEDLDERTSLRDFKCRVCFQENIEVALVPCFHCSYCRPCAEKLTECAICRTIKFGVQTVYLS
ncbi:hypothetical protein O0I10_007476 [Lichtheimia ornata]|uniref:RING-type domain-containing protein n=1 Tax=Lichtheimia ornata TaxID=688661 RepID=A0AAD7V192_9FUNG|nr:uncharacterized protein O0I10_007476 [Lichtheimia ornata]KAJ8656879.1 hypothetical protein O0I10_007476 [Lichtheimia ornata]